MTERLWDPGVQNERTALAWQRTALALLVSAVLTARIVMADAPAAGTALAALSLAVAGWLIGASRRRYARSSRALHAQRSLPDGRLPAATACLTAGLGAVEILHLIAR